MREQALGVLLSYNPFWLRLGMEVVTQQSVARMQGGAKVVCMVSNICIKS